MGSEVNEVINNICDKLGYAALEITPEMAKYMIAKDGVTLILCSIGIVLGVLVIKWALKHYREVTEENPYYDSLIEWIITLAMAIVVLSAIATACIASTDLVGWIASPKASMVQYVLDAIK